MASAAQQLASNLNWGAIGKATELKKRLWFTAGRAGRLPRRSLHPGAGCRSAGAGRDVRPECRRHRRHARRFSGGAIGRMSVLALNIMPYISASIIMQILTTVVPSLEALKKEGEAGRKKINQYTRYGTVILAAFQAYGIAVGLESQSPRWGRSCPIPACSSACHRDYAGRRHAVPDVARRADHRPRRRQRRLADHLRRHRRGPAGRPGGDSRARPHRCAFGAVHHRADGRRGRGGGGRRVHRDARSDESSCSIPSARSATACMAARPRTCRSRSTPRASSRRSSPPRCCSSRRPSPRSRAAPARAAGPVDRAYLAHGQPLYLLRYIGLIVFFCFFYTTVVFNPVDTADNLKKNGGFIPGIPRQEHCRVPRIHPHRLTVIGAISRRSASCPDPDRARRRAVLFRRHQPADRGLGDARHGFPDPGPPARPSVRRPDQEGTAARSCGDEHHPSGTAGRGKGTPGAAPPGKWVWSSSRPATCCVPR